MNKYNFYAPCLFGLEKPLADELRDMGAENVTAENGRVLFSGDDDILARANICSRYAERIGIQVGSFDALSFAALFDCIKALPWEKYIGRKDAFPVKGWSLNSVLHSVPDCQSIIKKAIVNRLSEKYGITWFEESGATCRVSFSILKNRVSVCIDTSGEGLHKRGYRRDSNAAPIKETLAAAMVYFARIYNDSTVYDPFCGSGTILIEAAMAARNIAPGLRRSFAGESLPFIDGGAWQRARARAQDMIDNTVPFCAVGTDIDPAAVELTLHNAEKAGVAGCVKASVADVADFSVPTARGVVITNPPYGERMLELDEAERLYRVMGKVFTQRHGLRYAVISPDDRFEQLFGRPADKRRKLYNGSIRCQLYMYYR